MSVTSQHCANHNGLIGVIAAAPVGKVSGLDRDTALVKLTQSLIPAIIVLVRKLSETSLSVHGQHGRNVVPIVVVEHEQDN